MNIIKSTGTFSFYTLISRISGYFRDILIAIFLGSGPIADAFFVAFRIPNTFRRIFGEGSFNAAFVPSYAKELTKSKKNSENFANKVFSLLTFSLLGLVILVELLMPLFVSLIAPGFKSDPEKFILATDLTRITFPFILFISLASFFSAILNSHNKFAAASAAPIILNLVLIVILLYAKYLDDYLVIYMSYGVSVAGLIQMIFLIFTLKKIYKPQFKINLNIDNKTKSFFKKLLPSIFSSGVTQINILIGTIIASFQAGAVSYLYYADRIYQINLAIAGIAIGTVILPKLSSYIAQKKLKNIDLIQNKSLELSLFLSLPAMVGLLIASEEIVSSLFGYGSFDQEGVANSANALFYFALGLPAFSLIKILSNFVFARDNTKIPFYFSLASVTLNILISVTFFNKIGFIIIPISTSLSSWINVLLLFYYLRIKNYYSLDLSSLFINLKTICSALISSYFFYYMVTNYSSYLDYDSKYKLIFLIIMILLTFFIYILIATLTKAFKFSDIKLKY